MSRITLPIFDSATRSAQSHDNATALPTPSTSPTTRTQSAIRLIRTVPLSIMKCHPLFVQVVYQFISFLINPLICSFQVCPILSLSFAVLFYPVWFSGIFSNSEFLNSFSGLGKKNVHILHPLVSLPLFRETGGSSSTPRAVQMVRSGSQRIYFCMV